jgi:hypothetical protein
MSATPVIVIFTAAVALGAVLFVLWLRDQRRPVLIGVHLLLGAGGLEQLAMYMGQTSLKPTAGALFAAALICGLVAALMREAPRAATAVLFTHIALGLAGFAVLLLSLPVV